MCFKTLSPSSTENDGDFNGVKPCQVNTLCATKTCESGNRRLPKRTLVSKHIPVVPFARKTSSFIPSRRCSILYVSCPILGDGCFLQISSPGTPGTPRRLDNPSTPRETPPELGAPRRPAQQGVQVSTAFS